MENSYHVLLAMILGRDIIIQAVSRDEAIRIFHELKRKVFHLLWLLSN